MVYFVQSGDNGPIKIGYCRDDDGLDNRIKLLQTGNPDWLHVLAVIPGVSLVGEGWLHRAFDGSRLRGEWFNRTPALLALIDAVNAGRVPPELTRRLHVSA